MINGLLQRGMSMFFSVFFFRKNKKKIETNVGPGPSIKSIQLKINTHMQRVLNKTKITHQLSRCLEVDSMVRI